MREAHERLIGRHDKEIGREESSCMSVLVNNDARPTTNISH